MLILWLLICFLLNLKVGLGSSVCSCPDSISCGPIRGKASRSEVVGFTLGEPNSGYQLFDWNKLTTVILAHTGTPATNDIVCLAHQNNVKVQFLAGFSTQQLVNDTFRTTFINETVKKIQKYNLDGVNIDYEDAVTPEAYNVMNTMMQQLRAALQAANPLYQISVDYVFCPFCSPSRTFDVHTIKNYIDYFVLMDYDMQGYLTYRSRPNMDSLCWKVFNSPLPAIIRGMKSFLQADIPASQLVLAFPWYGNYYKCEVLNTTDNLCYVDCDSVWKVKHQMSFKDIMNLLRSGPYQRMWNSQASVPFFNYVNQDGSTYQVNYDDPVSLDMKYNVTKSYNLRGLGIWTLDSVDYSNTDKNATMDRIEMWNTIPGGD